ncbi:hypothetical protein [Brevibacterium sp. VCM10]|uniref:hypothetical protein n=1 Tax=Brevibacterium sp. VCM10 TaxID=1381751 RepID=UPI0004704F14|nr:hypothetical protein [Brevibacterium sp. VCM10]
MTLDRLYRDVENLKKQYRGLAGGPQLALSSIENGAIDSKDAEGNLKMTIGQQDDGGNTIHVISGPTPPTPVGFTVEVDFGQIRVHWNGDFDADALAPSDYARTEVYVQAGDTVVPSRLTAKGSMVAASGGEVKIGVEKGSYAVCLVAWSQAGKMSAPSAPVDVEVPGYGDIVLEEIDAAATLIKNAGEMLIEGQQTLADKLAGIADLDPEEISDEIAQARQEAIDAALAEIANVEGTLTSAIGGKSSTKWSTADPPVNYDGAVGDTWVKLTSLGSGGREIRRSRWQGNVWVEHHVDGAVLSNVDASTITTGFLDVVNRIRAGAILADKLLIGGDRNLIPNGDLNVGSNAGWPANAEYAATGGPNNAPMVTFPAGSYVYNPFAGTRFPVAPGETLVFEAWVKADTPNSALYVTIQDQTGANTSTAGRLQDWTDIEGGGAGATQGPIAKYTVPTSWTKVVSSKVVPAGVESIIVQAFYLNHSSGTNTSAKVSFSGMKLYKPVGGTLIEPGGIQTPHLAADVLEVGNFKAGTAALAEAVIKKLFAEVVVARMSQAEEFIGENALLTNSVTAPKIVASEELWAKLAQFVEVRAEMMDADVFRNRLFEGVDIIGSRFTVKDENDDVRTQLSAAGNTFKGEVEADTLVVNEGAEFKANNTLAQGAKLTLAAGVTDPTAPPVVQPYWEGVEFTPPSDATPVGLTFDGTHYWTAEAWPEIGAAWKIDAATGAAEQVSLPSAWGRLFGVTCIGSELYWLTLTNHTSTVIVTDLNLTQKREFEYEDIAYSSTNPLVYKPGIGNDGTSVVIAQCTDAGDLIFRTYNKTTGAKISGVSIGENVASDIVGVYVGAGDFGSNHMVAARASNNSFIRYTVSGNRVDAGGWFAAEPGSTGVVFHDGKFRALDPAGKIVEYADINTGDESGDWWAVYAWAEDWDDNGITETWSRISPPKRFTWPRRAGIKFIGQPLPDGVQMILPAIAKKETIPTRTDFHSPTWSFSEGRPVAWYDELPTDWASKPSPRDNNNFPEAEKAVLESASGTYRVEGDGSGRWGPLTFFPNGSWSGAVVSGQVVITSPSANSTTSVEVTFPPGRFVNIPELTLTAYTSAPRDVSVGVRDVSATSFTINMFSTSSGPRRVAWIAFDQGA